MTTLAPPATIAFLGLGMMGRPMAARLAEAGFKLRLFDISQKAGVGFRRRPSVGAGDGLAQGGGCRAPMR